MGRLTWVALAAMAAWGCDGGEQADAGPRPDGAAPIDGGRVDASDPPPDGGDDPDASSPDGGMPTPACAPPPAFDVGVTYARTLHVATDGDDGNDGSAGAPLQTIGAAARMATPGTEVRVAAGTYPAQNLGTGQGEEGAPIAFVADGDVTIDASSGTGWAMQDAAWVVIEGFTIADAMVHGMNLDDGGDYSTPAHHLVLRDLTVRDAGSGGNNDCIKMSGVDDFWLIGNEISGCDRGEAVDMVGCHRGVITGNHVHDVVQNGVQAKGGSADTLIHGNLFEDIPGRAVNAGGSTGLAFFRPDDAPHEAARIRVQSNVFVRVGGMSGASIAYVGCDACSFVHNTIVEPQTWIARILQESTDARFVPSRDGVFANNIIVLNTADLRTWVNVGGGTSPETFTFANNLWFALDEDASWSGPTFSDGIPPETGAIIQMDPQMVDRAGGDYRLMPGSPAQGAGRAETLAGDRSGACYAEPPTLGAYEIAP